LRLAACGCVPAGQILRCGRPDRDGYPLRFHTLPFVVVSRLRLLPHL
jgi:hypothetical protein